MKVYELIQELSQMQAGADVKFCLPNTEESEIDIIDYDGQDVIVYCKDANLIDEDGAIIDSLSNLSKYEFTNK